MPPNFSKAADVWFGARNKLSVGTVVKYRANLANLKRHFARMLVCDLTAQRVASYQQKRLQEKAAPATINSEVICLGSVLRHYDLWQRLKNGVALLEI